MAKKSKKSASSKKIAPVKKKRKSAIRLDVHKLGSFKYVNWVALAVIVLLTLFLRIPILDLPLDRDEGTYMYLGKMITEGGTIYEDGTEMKPPGIFLSYALIDLIFGCTTRSMHIALLLFNILSAWFVFLITKRWLNPIAGIVSALSFVLLSIHPHLQGQALVSEPIMNVAFLGGMALLTAFKKGRSYWWLIGAGALLGWSLLIKQNGLFHIAIGGIYLLFYGFPRVSLKDRTRWRNILFYGAGAIGIGLICALYILISGSWADFWYWNITYPKSQYLASFTFSDGLGFLKGIWKRITDFNGLLWYAGGAGILAHVVAGIFKKEWGRIAIIAFWLVLSALMILPGYRFYGHYWHFIVPVVALGIGFLMFQMQRICLRFIPKPITTILPLALMSIYLIKHIPEHAWYYQNDNELEFVRRVYGLNPFYELEEISKYLKSSMGPEDRLMVFGSEAQVYLQTGKDMPHETTYFTFLIKNHERGPALREALKQELQADPPEYVVQVQHPYSWSITERDDQTFYQWAYNFQRNNYDAVAYADMVSGAPPVFLYDDDAGNYTPKSNQYVVVYKLRN